MSLRGRGAARVVSGPRSWSTARSLGSESLSGAGNKSRKPPPGRAPRRPPAAPAPRPGAADHGLWRQGGNAGGDEPDSHGGGGAAVLERLTVSRLRVACHGGAIMIAVTSHDGRVS